jgi:hypothetical protein
MRRLRMMGQKMKRHEELCGKECKGNSIDQQVDEKKAELDRIYNRFNKVGFKCACTLCGALEEYYRNRKYRKDTY